MFLGDVAGCFGCCGARDAAGRTPETRAPETTETFAPLRDIALKHRLPTSAWEANWGEEDVYFRA